MKTFTPELVALFQENMPPPPLFFLHIKVWCYRNKNSPVPRAARYFRVIYCLFQAKTKSALPFGITVRQETLNTTWRAGFHWRILTHLIDSPNSGRQPRVTRGKSQQPTLAKPPNCCCNAEILKSSFYSQFENEYLIVGRLVHSHR